MIASAIDTLVLWIDFFAGAIRSAVDFLAKLPQMLGFVRDVIALVPAEIRGFAFLSVSLSVLLMFASFLNTSTTGGN